MPNENDQYKPVAQGHIPDANKPHGKLFKAVFSEPIGEVKEHIIYDVVVPMFKNLIAEAANKTIEMILGTKGKSYRDDYRDRREDYVPYASYYKYGDYRDRRDDYIDYTPRYAYWDIDFSTKAEADDILSHLRFIVQDEGAVDLATLYEISRNKQMIGPNDFEWGWDDLRGVETRRLRNGRWGFANLRRVKPIPKRR